MTVEPRMTVQELREFNATKRLPVRFTAPASVDRPPSAVTAIEPTEGDGETEIQAEIIRELRALGFVAFHVPNGGKRRRIEAAILKGIGVLAGVADVGVLLLGGRIAWLEVKTETGKPSPAQRRFAGWCRKLSHEYHLVRSWPEVAPIAATWERYELGEAI